MPKTNHTRLFKNVDETAWPNALKEVNNEAVIRKVSIEGKKRNVLLLAGSCDQDSTVQNVKCFEDSNERYLVGWVGSQPVVLANPTETQTPEVQWSVDNGGALTTNHTAARGYTVEVGKVQRMTS